MLKKMTKLLGACAIVAMAFAVMVPASAFALTTSGTCGTCAWEIDSDGVLTVHEGTLDNDLNNWLSDAALGIVARVEITENVKTGTSCASMFRGCEATSMDLSGLDTSAATSMDSMFKWCWYLETLDLSNFDTSNVRHMSEMFTADKALTSLDMSLFNTKKVADMMEMFSDCEKLSFLDLSSFDTSAVTNMSRMFEKTDSLVKVKVGSHFSFNSNNGYLPVQSFDGADGLWYSELTNVGYEPNAVPSLRSATYFATTPAYRGISTVVVDHGISGTCEWDINSDGVLTVHAGTLSDSPADDEGWLYLADRSKISRVVVTEHVKTGQSAASLFRNLGKVVSMDLSGFDTSNAKSMSRMFANCASLKSLNVSSFNVSRVGDMSNMFAGCESLTSLDLSKWNTASLFDMFRMFYDCSSLTSLSLSGLNTSKVTSMSGAFRRCTSLKSLNLSGFNTVKVREMDGMFAECWALASVNLSSFDTSRATTMSNMFYNCRALKSLTLSGFNTSAVTDMSYMFYGCSALASLNLSTFKTSKVTRMECMFNGCSALKSLNLSGWDTSKVTDMFWMFRRCRALSSLNLTSFNTSQVVDMSEMFGECSALTALDLSSFDTSKTKYMDLMFSYCSALKQIKLGAKFAWSFENPALPDNYFPRQSFANATGKWYDSKTHVGYAPNEVPSLTAATYYATKPASRGVAAPKKGQKWTAKGTDALFTVKIKKSKKKSKTVVITKVKKLLSKSAAKKAAPKSKAKTASLASDDSPNVGLMAGSGYWSGTSITVPKTVTIGDYVYLVVGLGPGTFANSTAKTAYIEATRVTTIPIACFQNCKNLQTVTLPKNVKNIGAKAFYGCKSLSTIRIMGKGIKKSTIGKKAFSKTYKKMKVYAPKKKLKSYKKAFRARGLSKKAKFKKI